MSDATEGVGEGAAEKEKAGEVEAEKAEAVAKPAEAPPAEVAKFDAAAEAPPAEVAKADSAPELPPAEVAKVDSAPEAPPAEVATADSASEAPPAEVAKTDSALEAPPAEVAKADAAAEVTPAESAEKSEATPAEAADPSPAAEEPPAEPEPAPAPEPEPPKAPAPAITGLEPATVGVKGGTIVTILGCDFARGCAVLIDDVPVPSARAHGGRLEAVVSPHAAGVVDVAVKNPDGQRTTLPAALRFAEPPILESITPARGVTTGGFELTLRGLHFEAGCAVLFDGEPVADVAFVSETELRLRAPGHAATAGIDVTVVNPNALSHRLPQAFAYETAPPRIASLEPAFGPNAGGTRVTIRGTDLDAKCAVFVCGIAATVTWKSREEIEIAMPAVARDGLVDVRLVNADDQAATLDKAFRYDAPLAPPVLTTVSPNRGSQTGGIKITLIGEDFADGAVVRIAGHAADVKYLNKKQLEVTVPAYAGSGDVNVEVVNPDGVASALENAFTYEARPAPAISGITPNFGPSTGGTKVVIEGSNFTKDCQVYVGREYPKDLAIKSATEIHIVTAPRKTPGVVDIEVAAPGLPKAVMKNGFRYDAVPAPIITSISPNAGAVGGGTEMSITGKNFRKDTIVLVDGRPPKAVKFIDAQTLELKTPPGDANKMVDVIVRNPDGKEAIQKRAFMYDPRYR